MDAESFGKIENLLWFVAGGATVVVGALEYFLFKSNRELRDEKRQKYEKMLTDYDKRISRLPKEERMRLLNLHTAESYVEEGELMDEKRFDKLEARLQKDLQKRRAINPREISLCNAAEVRY